MQTKCLPDDLFVVMLIFVERPVCADGGTGVGQSF